MQQTLTETELNKLTLLQLELWEEKGCHGEDNRSLPQLIFVIDPAGAGGEGGTLAKITV